MSKPKKTTEFEIAPVDSMRVKPEERTPNYVVCGGCQHSWIGFYTPIPVTDFGKIAKGMRCPMCAGKKIFVKMG